MIFQKEKTPFQAIKTRSSKSRKIDIFPKGLVHGFGPKLAIFPPFFQAIQARKMCFMIFQNEKTPFQAIKTRSSKTRKIDIFPKGLIHGFSPKLAIFRPCIFQAIQARKMCFMIFQNEKTFFQAIKTRSSKSRKIDIFPKRLVHGFGPKLAIFPQLFLGNIGQENVFQDILEHKIAFLGCKNKKFKKRRKKEIFPKRLVHGFGPKLAIFPQLFLGNIGQKNVFFDNLEQKNFFQAIKRSRTKSRTV